MSGLLDVLTAHIWPRYEFSKATLGPVGRVTLSKNTGSTTHLRISTAPEGERKKWLPPGKQKQTAIRKGMRTGIRVGLQLGDVIKDCRGADIELNEWWNGYKLYSERMQLKGRKTAKSEKSGLEKRYKESVPASVRKRYRYIHPHTSLVLSTLLNKGLIPIQTELPVGCVAMRMCTGVDVVCRHVQSGTLVLVELKTGYDSYWHRHTPFPMKGPFAPFHDAPINQHLLQLLFTRLLFNVTCNAKGQERVEALLLRVGTAGVDLIRLPAWATERASAFWDWIKMARTKAQ